MPAADPIGGLVALALANAEISAIVGTRVFGGELPAEETQHMPRQALVLRPSGGSSLTGGSKATHDTMRFDAFAFGATPNEASALMAEFALAMRLVTRVVSAGVLIHWVNPAGGAASGREPGTEWPRQFQSFQMFHALESVG